MKTIILAVKREYFEAIKSGEKTEEYREVKEYWIKRLVGKNKYFCTTLMEQAGDKLIRPIGFDNIVITLGYTKQSLKFKYKGFKIKTITHKHFGNIPTRVFAIDLSERINNETTN